jgi:hypothetical protein
MRRVDRIKKFRQYILYWTGWKQDAGSIRVNGQWIAVQPKEQRICYSDTGGSVGYVETCEDFNVWPSEVTILTNRQEKDRVKNLTLELLVQFLKAREDVQPNM